MTEPKYLTIESITQEEKDRFFAKILIDEETRCWNWTAALNNYGYGEFWFRNRMELAHRFAYALLKHPIPQGVSPDIPNLDHVVCDNPRCCNPDHLELTLPRNNLFRGNSVSSVNRRKTHCIHGHPLPAEPNRESGNGRYCPTCRAENSKKTYLRRKSSPVHEHDLEKKREWARRQRKVQD